MINNLEVIMYLYPNTKQTYTEIDCFIELLTESDKQKIPIGLREFFKENKDANYRKELNINIPFKEQDLKKETLALIAMLYLYYICEDEKEKKELMKIYDDNEKKRQKELQEKYNPENIFHKTDLLESKEEVNQLLVLKKETVFKRIVDFIKRVLKVKK